MARIKITLDDSLLARLDRLVAMSFYSSRSGAIEAAVSRLLGRTDHVRLGLESAKLDRCFEQTLAEESVRSGCR
jgi:metal-responsive CopG/Arc/MetJ family transcriptional regulator